MRTHAHTAVIVVAVLPRHQQSPLPSPTRALIYLPFTPFLPHPVLGSLDMPPSIDLESIQPLIWLLSYDFSHISLSIYDYCARFSGLWLVLDFVFFYLSCNSPVFHALSLYAGSYLYLFLFIYVSHLSIPLLNPPSKPTSIVISHLFVFFFCFFPHTHTHTLTVLVGPSVSQLCKQEAVFLFIVPEAWVAEQGYPYNCTIMGIQDGREGSHKITREKRGRQEKHCQMRADSSQKHCWFRFSFGK